MTRRNKWLLGAAVLLVLLAAAWVALIAFLPSDEELARRIETELEEATGVKVVIGAVHWRVLPAPAITIEDFATHQEQPLKARTLTLYPRTGPLLRERRLRVREAVLEGAVVPTVSLGAFRGKVAPSGRAPASAPAVVEEEHTSLETLRFRELTWISRTGIAVPFEGEIDFDPKWRPRTADIRRAGFKPQGRMLLTRQGDADRWTAKIALGGGTADGEVALETSRDGVYALSGKFAPRNVEIEATANTFNRNSPVRGRANGESVLAAQGRSAGELGRSFRLRTEFTAAPATVPKFDLDKAIRTLGKDKEGQTELRSLAGTMDMQNTERGMVVRYENLVAEGETFRAQLDATVFRRQVEAQGQLELAKGAVAVPFQLSGPTQHPKVSIAPGVLAGALAGTAVLPVVGTVIGARIGGALGRVFGRKKEPPNLPQPRQTPLRALPAKRAASR